MRTIVLEKPGTFRLADTPEPGDPGAGEALVQVRRIGICGTDYHAIAGNQPAFEYPRVLGHELGVEVLDVGDGVDHVAPGDRCAVEPYLNCGHCIACAAGRTNCCETLEVFGVHIDGGMQERILVPAAKLHPSASLSFDQLALVEMLGIGCHAVGRAAIREGETILIVGVGPIGLSVIPFARAAGARIAVADVVPRRLDFCRTHVGVDAALLGPDLTPERLREELSGELPTAVFEATGNSKSMAASFHLPAQGGRLIFLGIIRDNYAFPDPEFHRRELSLLASRNAAAPEFRRIIGMMEQGEINPDVWISHRAEFGDFIEAIDRWRQPDSDVIKAMVSLED